MARYKVTHELTTPKWKRFLRKLGLWNKMKTFTLILSDEFEGFDCGVTLFGSQGKVKIVEILK